jgi:hypothetical protein
MDVWHAVTLLGEEKTFIILLPAIYYLFSPRIGYRCSLLLILTALSVHLLKNVFKVPRPCKGSVTCDSGYSFPSGHATATTSLWLYLYFKRRKNVLLLTAIVLIVLVSISRVVLGVHRVVDIIAGIVLGFFLSTAFYKIDRKVKVKKKRAKKVRLLLIVAFSPLLLFLPKEAWVIFAFLLAHSLIPLEKSRKKILSCTLTLPSFYVSLFLVENPLLSCKMGK